MVAAADFDRREKRARRAVAALFESMENAGNSVRRLADRELRSGLWIGGGNGDSDALHVPVASISLLTMTHALLRIPR